MRIENTRHSTNLHIYNWLQLSKDSVWLSGSEGKEVNREAEGWASLVKQSLFSYIWRGELQHWQIRLFIRKQNPACIFIPPVLEYHYALHHSLLGIQVKDFWHLYSILTNHQRSSRIQVLSPFVPFLINHFQFKKNAESSNGEPDCNVNNLPEIVKILNTHMHIKMHKYIS